jgi:hypothetical protein
METNTKSKMIRSLVPTYILNGRFRELEQGLDGLIERGDDETLEIINRTLARPENLSLLIEGICGSKDMLDRTVASSYYHENGFHKIVLLSGRMFKLRLHHFGVTAKIPMENIHDHRWCFASTILSGELNMDLFTVSEKGSRTEKAYHFIYESDKSGGSYRTDFVSVAHLRKSESRTYVTGDTYLMRTHELHRIRNKPGRESVTLILTGKPVGSRCNLYSRREKILEEEKQTVAYDRNVLVRMLGSLSEKVYPKRN